MTETYTQGGAETLFGAPPDAIRSCLPGTVRNMINAPRTTLQPLGNIDCE